MKFYIGTTNPNKVMEIGSILAATGCSFETIDPIDPEETADDFDGNALLKAIAYAQYSRGVTISEDSGLIISALGGLPGPWSARFSDYDVDMSTGRVKSYNPSYLLREEMDRSNNNRVLRLMEGIEMPRRSAYFKVVLIVAEANGSVLFKAAGESHGWIADKAKGTNGFGYDPIFIGADTFDKTYAELDSMRKNLRSHRKRVLDEFKAWLGRYLKEQKL